MKSFRAALGLCVFLVAALPCLAAERGMVKIPIRGQDQEVHFFPGSGAGPHRKVLFAPGDGGWRGFAITIAEQLSVAGYDVYGLDTRHYLESFTAVGALTPAQVATDFAQMAEWLRQGDAQHVLLVGWSEGAGLGLAAAAHPASRNIFDGLVAVGMTEYNILGWRWRDLGAEITKKLPNEPNFRSADYLGSVPLPVFMIASSRDEYVSPAITQQLFSTAREPKRLVVIDAADHKYGGKTDEFFRTLKAGLSWIQQQHG